MIHLPVLPLLLPLLVAPLCWVFNHSRIAWWLTLAVTIAVWVICIFVYLNVDQSGSLVYQFGGWTPPLGIEYRIDIVSAWMLLIISSISVLVAGFALDSVEREIDAERQVYLYVAFLLCLGALLGIVSSADIFNIFVLLEISALATYVLIAMGAGRAALWASFQYLIVGTVGATFFLIGVGLLYAMTGTLNLADLSSRLESLHESPTVITAFCFISMGILLKIAIFPIHIWLVHSYTHAPSVVSAFLAATATKTAIYLLIRLYFSVFGMEFLTKTLPVGPILITIGLMGVFLGSARALSAQHLKTVFAYSSVSQVGFLLIGIGLLNQTGLTATIIHLFNHAIMKALVFLALGAVLFRLGGVNLKDINGLGRQMPWTMAALVIAGLSLIGFPMTAGFISKWYLIVAAIEKDYWILVLAILLGSLLTALYVWRLVEAAYFRAPQKQVTEVPLLMLLPILLLAGFNIYFGLETTLTVGTAESAARLLFLGER